MGHFIFKGIQLTIIVLETATFNYCGTHPLIVFNMFVVFPLCVWEREVVESV